MYWEVVDASGLTEERSWSQTGQKKRLGTNVSGKAHGKRRWDRRALAAVVGSFMDGDIDVGEGLVGALSEVAGVCGGGFA